MVKKPKFSIVDGQGYEQILAGIVGQLVDVIRKHQLKPKMATKLMQDAWLRAEQAFRSEREAYIRKSLEKQIQHYVELGLHTAVGEPSGECFRGILQPLIEKTVEFFSKYLKN